MANRRLSFTWTETCDLTSVSHTMPRARSLFLFIILMSAAPVSALPSAEQVEKNFMVFQGYFEYFGWLAVVVMSVFGFFANIINIRVYSKMGVKESVNVVFYSISWADLVCCFFGIFYHAFQHPWFRMIFMDYFSLQVWEVPGAVTYICAVMCHTSSALITAYMALQRCLCVAIPMKVKNIFTIRRTKISMICIVVYCILVCVPYLFILKFDWLYVNDTVNGTVVNERKFFGRIRFESFYRKPLLDFVNHNQTLIKMSVNVLIIVCTIILWRNLVSKSKWRKDVTDSDTAASASRKEIRIIKTVVFICTLYVITSFPNTAFLVYFLSEPGFRVAKWTVFHLCMYRFLFIVTSLATCVNVASNIFIYYNVSTQYRDVFNQMFSFHRWKVTKEATK